MWNTFKIYDKFLLWLLYNAILCNGFHIGAGHAIFYFRFHYTLGDSFFIERLLKSLLKYPAWTFFVTFYKI